MSAVDPYKKTCKYDRCNKTFQATRMNSDYCCKEHKIKAANEKAKAERNLINDIQFQIKLSWRALQYLYDCKKTEVTMEELNYYNFQYKYHTSSKLNKEIGYIIPEYFNFALEPLKDNKFKIVKLW